MDIRYNLVFIRFIIFMSLSLLQSQTNTYELLVLPRIRLIIIRSVVHLMAQTTCPLILIFSTLSWNHLYSYKTTSQYRIQHKPTTVNPIRSAEPERGGGSPRHSETSHAGKLRFFSGDKRKQLLNHQLVCAVQRLKQIHLIYHTHVWFTTLN